MVSIKATAFVRHHLGSFDTMVMRYYDEHEGYCWEEILDDLLDCAVELEEEGVTIDGDIESALEDFRKDWEDERRQMDYLRRYGDG